ncbi:MAG: hypothetical protein HUK22_08285, partial [Thermoguttaceae bacterium]|nr:hypothetical protein [Thermoguttaceae bacterium]
MKLLFRIVSWCVFLALLAVIAAGTIAYRRADIELDRIANTELQRKFPDLETSFRSAEFDSTRGVRLHSVAWRRLDAPPEEPPILTAEEIFVAIPIESVAKFEFKPRKIVITRPQLQTQPKLASFMEDLRSLQPAPGGTPCPIEIVDAAILFDDAPRSIAKTEETVAYEPQNAEDVKKKNEFVDWRDVVGDAPVVAGMRMEILPQFNEDINEPLITWLVDFRASNPYVKEARAELAVSSAGWTAKGSATALDFASLISIFSGEINDEYSFLRNMRGYASFNFEAENAPEAPAGVHFDVNGTLSRGAVVMPFLKFPAADVEAQFSATEREIVVPKATARCGETELTGAFQLKSPKGAPQTGRARLIMKNFQLDDASLKKMAEQYAAFSVKRGKSVEQTKKFLEFLSDYRFSAATNVDLALLKEANSDDWTPAKLSVDAKDGKLLYSQFPYQLERLAGSVDLSSSG